MNPAMDGLVMRAARPEDATGIAALVAAAYAPHAAVLGKRPAPMDDDYPARIRAGQAFVADLPGAPMAGVLVLVDEPGVLLVDNVAVSPAVQAAGLGRALLRWAETEATRRRHHVLRLYTNERMAANVAWYGRLGYRETHRLEEHGHRRVFMAKRIAPGPAPGPGGSQPR